jgi:hypothetical protein
MGPDTAAHMDPQYISFYGALSERGDRLGEGVGRPSGCPPEGPCLRDKSIDAALPVGWSGITSGDPPFSRIALNMFIP